MNPITKDATYFIALTIFHSVTVEIILSRINNIDGRYHMYVYYIRIMELITALICEPCVTCTPLCMCVHNYAYGTWLLFCIFLTLASIHIYIRMYTHIYTFAICTNVCIIKLYKCVWTYLFLFYVHAGWQIHNWIGAMSQWGQGNQK